MSGMPIVVVAALTFRRPAMLARLIEAWGAVSPPRGWEVRWLVVDNDPGGSARDVVVGSAAEQDLDVRYVVEPERGIPAGRNRALDEAGRLGANVLCFVDDDEFPEPGWLEALVACRDRTGAVLVGGPTRLLPLDRPTGAWTRFLSRSLAARSALLERRWAERAQRGRVVVLATNNWLGDLSWLTSRGIRFDPAFRDSGGSDTAFARAVEAAGGRIAWCEHAIVYEHLSAARATLGYQFRASRDRGILLARHEAATFRGMAARQLPRMLAGAGLMVVPALGAASFAIGLHLVAAGIGRFAARFGARSRLYTDPR